MSDANDMPTHSTGTRKGEEITDSQGKEPGRQDSGESPAGRPTGTRTGRDSSTVTPSDPIDPDSPDMPPA